MIPISKKIASALLFTISIILFENENAFAQTCTDFAVVVGNWSDASLQKFDGSTGNYVNQLNTGIGQKINSIVQYPSPNGFLYLGGYEEVNVVNAFTGAVQFSFTGGPLSGLSEQIAVGQDGMIYVASEGSSAGNGAILRYNATTGVYIDTFIGFPSYQPNGLVQDTDGSWYVSTRNSPNTVLKYSSSGSLLGTVTTLGTSGTGGGLKIYGNELYVVTTDSPQTVEVYSLPVTSFPATPVRTINSGGSTFVGIDFGPDGHLYMADFYNGRVSVWNPITGAFVKNITDGSIGNPHGVGFTGCVPCVPPAANTFTAVSATCTAGVPNNDASLEFTGLNNATKYIYGTDSTSFTSAAATSFSSTDLSISGIANPSSPTDYFVRFYNASGLCFKTFKVTVSPAVCNSPCVQPTINSFQAVSATCTAATANADAKIEVVGTNADKYAITEGTVSTATYASAQTLSSGMGSLTNLANPLATKPYIIRVFNGSDACFKDQQVNLLPANCLVPCKSPTCGTVTVLRN